MILSIGDLLLDITIVPSGPLRPDDDNPARIDLGGGGQAANFCAWAAALEAPGRSLDLNVDLVVNNARIAAQVAANLA